jgi:hypothetical protein
MIGTLDLDFYEVAAKNQVWRVEPTRPFEPGAAAT